MTICRSWLGTPYVFRAHVKGAGADCSTWLAESMIEAGIATREELYGGLNIHHQDWWHHISDDVYRRRLLRHAVLLLETTCRRSTNALPGCIVLQHAAGSHVGNHSGVVTNWPMIIHCIAPKVDEVDAVQNPMWVCKAISVFDPFES